MFREYVRCWDEGLKRLCKDIALFMTLLKSMGRDVNLDITDAEIER